MTGVALIAVVFITPGAKLLGTLCTSEGGILVGAETITSSVAIAVGLASAGVVDPGVGAWDASGLGQT